MTDLSGKTAVVLGASAQAAGWSCSPAAPSWRAPGCRGAWAGAGRCGHGGHGGPGPPGHRRGRAPGSL